MYKPDNDVNSESDTKPADMDQGISLAGMQNGANMDLECPAWDLSKEYESIDSEKFQSHLKELLDVIKKVQDLTNTMQEGIANTIIDNETFQTLCPVAQRIRNMSQRADVIFADISAYVDCFLSIESENEAAKKMRAKLDDIGADYSSAAIPLDLFETKLNESQLEEYLKDPVVQTAEFDLRRKAKYFRDFLLTSGEEKILSELAPSGFDAWWNLYYEISKDIRIEVSIDGETKHIGLGEADELLSDPNREIRKETWQKINTAWDVHKLAAAQGINSLIAQRLKENELRSKVREKNYLDDAFFDACVETATIEAMMAVAKKNLPIAHKAMSLIAKGIGAEHYQPWDKFAPFPEELRQSKGMPSKLSFPVGLQQLKDAFSSFHPDLGGFVDLCMQEKWIEARLLPGKSPGAYSTGFAGSGEPRTFLSYAGAQEHLQTLAHETGHSFHTWVMRDLPPAQRDYPMTLAETASNVGEMILSGYKSKVSDLDNVLSSSWEEIQAGIAYLVNIPLRYSFEKSVYERRKEEFLTPLDLCEEMRQADQEWYGDMSSVKDEMFWATKQHFHFHNISFYNFPYIFGYMFAMGIYARIEEQGATFYPAFVELLRDTGKMTCEDLAKKHLGVDLSHEDFWQSSYDCFARKVAAFEADLNKVKG